MRLRRATILFTLALILAWTATTTPQTFRTGQLRVVAVLPVACVVGEQVFLSAGYIGTYSCTATNVWEMLAIQRSHSFTLPDNTITSLFTVDLPTANTGCSVHHSFTYTATNGTTTGVTHSGIIIWTFVNQAGTVTSSSTDGVESSVGTGCGVGCDAWATAVVGTVATARATFNNTLSVDGLFTLRVLNNSCAITALL